MQSSLSDLTQAGTLYEGSDFEEWKARLSSRLLERYNVRLVTAQSSSFANRGLGRSRLAHREIFRAISQNIKCRIPNYNSTHPRFCAIDMELLKKFAKPFDIMSLPTELRIRIFQLFFDDRAVYIHDSGFSTTPESEDLLMATKTLRTEALPEFYKATHFFIDIIGSDTDVPAMLKKRLKEVVRQNHARHLRTVTVLFRQTSSPRVIFQATLELAKEGLSVEFTGLSDDKDGEAFERWVEAVDVERKEKGELGEAIIRALTAKPAVWKLGGVGK